MPRVKLEQSVLPRWWIFSPRWDMTVFWGSCLFSLLALGLGFKLGILYEESPDWTWVYAVLLVDVAHVWSTGFRVYFDADEVKRRPYLYFGVPLVSLAAGFGLYSLGSNVFWRTLAYLAVWHFVRQQYGWVVLYRRRAGEAPRDWTYYLDAAAIYVATIYPLLWWHAHLPRKFWWFLEGDFARLPAEWVTFLAPVYWLTLAAYTLKMVRSYSQGRGHPGKDTVVFTTWLCWYLGIIVFNSDYAFTVTNVLIHGVPYMALVYWYRQKKKAPDAGEPKFRWTQVVYPLLLVWFLAFAEEMFWDRAIWHERSWLFGHPWDIRWLEPLLVPLLAVPQLTHYILDGFIWKRRETPDLDRTKN
jgi:hypothetical protein